MWILLRGIKHVTIPAQQKLTWMDRSVKIAIAHALRVRALVQISAVIAFKISISIRSQTIFR